MSMWYLQFSDRAEIGNSLIYLFMLYFTVIYLYLNRRLLLQAVPFCYIEIYCPQEFAK